LKQYGNKQIRKEEKKSLVLLMLLMLRELRRRIERIRSCDTHKLFTSSLSILLCSSLSIEHQTRDEERQQQQQQHEE
jgi:hypothetical protein